MIINWWERKYIDFDNIVYWKTALRLVGSGDKIKRGVIWTTIFLDNLWDNQNIERNMSIDIEKLLHGLVLNTSSLSPSNQIISFQLINKIKNWNGLSRKIQHDLLKLKCSFLPSHPIVPCRFISAALLATTITIIALFL